MKVQIWPMCRITDLTGNIMPRLHLTVLRPGTKPYVWRNGFPSFSWLQYEESFLSSSQTEYFASLAKRKNFFTSFPFGTWLSILHV